MLKPGEMPSCAGWNKGKSQGAEWLKAHAQYDGEQCLIWPFSLTRGYGIFVLLQKKHHAHRYMCELVNGSAPTPEHHAAHSCGKGAFGCVHPKHVSWKTPSENQMDKHEHGTVWRQTARSKLSPHQVLEIRSLKGKMTQDEIARLYGVGRQNIGAILTGKSWPHIVGQ